MGTVKCPAHYRPKVTCLSEQRVLVCGFGGHSLEGVVGLGAHWAPAQSVLIGIPKCLGEPSGAWPDEIVEELEVCSCAVRGDGFFMLLQASGEGRVDDQGRRQGEYLRRGDRDRDWTAERIL